MSELETLREAVEALNARYETLAAEAVLLRAELAARDAELADRRAHVAAHPGTPATALIVALTTDLNRATDAATTYEQLFHQYKDWWLEAKADRELLEAVYAHATGKRPAGDLYGQ